MLRTFNKMPFNGSTKADIRLWVREKNKRRNS